MNPKQPNQEPNLDAMMLQRLIDGELETEQVQKILSQAQVSPQQWETIAVGFVENQVWQRTFNSEFAELSVGGGPIEAGDGENRGVAPSDITNESRLRPGPKPNSSDNQTRLKHRTPWWVMAASLLAAAAIGYMTSQIQNRSLPVNSIAENQPDTSKTPFEPELTAAALTPDFHVEVPAESGFVFEQQDSSNRVPVYRITNIEQLKQFQSQRDIESALPRRIVEQLAGSGYQIEQEIELVSGEVDNQSFVVPLRTIRFIPGQ